MLEATKSSAIKATAPGCIPDYEPFPFRKRKKRRKVGPFSKRLSFAMLDLRTQEGRYARDICDGIAADLGGAPNAAQQLLCQMFALKVLRVQMLVKTILSGETVNRPLGLALTFGAVLHLNRREPERALSLAEAAKALAAEQRLSLPFQPGMVHGAALVGQSAPEEAIAHIREGVTKSTGPGRPYGLAFLAERRAGTAIGRRRWPHYRRGWK